MNIWILLWLGSLGLMLLFASFVTIPYGFWLMGFCDRSGLFLSFYPFPDVLMDFWFFFDWVVIRICVICFVFALRVLSKIK